MANVRVAEACPKCPNIQLQHLPDGGFKAVTWLASLPKLCINVAELLAAYSPWTPDLKIRIFNLGGCTLNLRLTAEDQVCCSAQTFNSKHCNSKPYQL